ncbi:MAG: hypothetical protein JG774_420 [Desulfomicrobiaceae bacterium]|jgi:hypothetical protein|nr:PLDc_N domain-containing protein [Desulfomicrobiaceae bacterium]MBZ4648163.1 hypothetical protein [Desulfomicrobiaceae bacterium]MBZ4684675.1 hypothetical protein [Desulfomicrobiaceae bacterium]MDI3492797.1 hypothetical protein [Desulfomicrobiaceae bacterium]MDK2872659.1 hypothetical protein [Desulfomicrobiaceae bacterium]
MWIAEIPADKLIYAIPLLLVPILPNLWAIAHIYRHDFPSSTEKMAWLVAQIILPVFGGIGYILSGRKRARKP